MEILENKMQDLKVIPLTVAGFDLDDEEKRLLLTEYSQYEYICSEYTVVVEPGGTYVYMYMCIYLYIHIHIYSSC
jgi:hypothetical protein